MAAPSGALVTVTVRTAHLFDRDGDVVLPSKRTRARRPTRFDVAIRITARTCNHRTQKSLSADLLVLPLPAASAGEISMPIGKQGLVGQLRQ
jgi:hypothetical protein